MLMGVLQPTNSLAILSNVTFFTMAAGVSSLKSCSGLSFTQAPHRWTC